METKGLVIVITGDGKGKTTAAMGQAMRAVGHGYRVLAMHFLKGREYGEEKAAAYLPGFVSLKAGSGRFVDRQKPDPADRELARQGFNRAREAVMSGDYDMVILDEINVAVSFGFVALDELLALIDSRPPGVDLILTGRGAAPQVVARADLVSEIREVKHPFKSGVAARKGIEY